MISHPYTGITAAIATKHLKEKIVAPVFERLGIKVVVSNIDTDLLGTFSGEIPRVGTPKEVVLNKARLGITESALQYGLASEGAIGPDLSIPFVISDVECMAWIDTVLNLEILEFYRSFEIVAAHITVTKKDSLTNFLKRADFPNHSLIAKSENGSGQIFKGIDTFERLETAINEISKESEKLIIESDLRAHHSPSRRKNISAVAEKLVNRLSCLCPKCHAPGWGEVGYLYGLACLECKNFEEGAVRGKIIGCAGCDYTEEQVGQKKFIAPAECSICNP